MFLLHLAPGPVFQFKFNCSISYCAYFCVNTFSIKSLKLFLRTLELEIPALEKTDSDFMYQEAGVQRDILYVLVLYHRVSKMRVVE